MSDDLIQDVFQQAFEAEQRGQFRLARDLLRKVSDIDGALALNLRLHLGRMLVIGDSSLYDEAEVVLAAARSQAEQRGMPGLTAQAIHLLALLERLRGRHSKSLELLDSSPSCQQLDTISAETAQWHHYRGLIATDLGELTNGERFYFRALDCYRSLRHDPGIAEVCNSLANGLVKQGKTRVAARFAQWSLQLNQKLKLRFGEAMSHGTLGRIYVIEARYDDAAEEFQKDLAIAEELYDVRGQGIMLNSLGEIAVSQIRPNQAIEFFSRSRSVDTSVRNALHVQLGLGCAHLAANQLVEAEFAADRMEELVKEWPNDSPYRAALSCLTGAIKGRRGDPHAEQLLLSAIEQLRQKNLVKETIPWLYELRDIYHRQGQAAKAVQVMNQALNILSQFGCERGVTDAEAWVRTVDSPSLTRLALERQFPAHLIDELLSGRLTAPPPKEQHAAVLFSDIRDYTTLTEGMPATEIVDLLNQWFGEASRVILRHGGVIDKFIGDAIMALFGVPEPREDASAAAVRAAIEMREALAALNMEQRALGGREIRIGVGIDTGPLVVGYIGSHLRRSYTVIGDAVNTASRLESATKDFPGVDILISQKTDTEQDRYGAAETSFLGMWQLKGKQKPTPIYQVLGLRSASNHVSPIDSRTQ